MSPTPTAEIIAALERLRRDGSPQEITVPTSLPGRTHGLRLSLRKDQYVLVEAEVGPMSKKTTLPEHDSITYSVEGGAVRATSTAPADLDDATIALLAQYVADRADYLEYLIASGADER